MLEDWKSSRKRSEHFTEAEKTFIRDQFKQGATVITVARALKAARRTITHHYGCLRAEIGTASLTSPANYTARLYKGSFEL